MANFYGTDIDDASLGGAFVNFYGGDGNDFLNGNAGPNELYGGQGNDHLAGGVWTTFTGNGTVGNPWVFTSFQASGNDTLEGGTGRDQIYGADGNDVLYGGDGDDSGSVAGWNGNFISAGLFGGDNDDFLDGGNGNDSLEGGNGNDTLLGGFGNDTGQGGAGVDDLTCGDGNDLLDGGTDADRMSGGLGDDTFLVDNAADLVIEAEGSGFDTVRTTVSYGLAVGASVEVLETTDAAGLSEINLTGNAFSQTITGNAGVNILSGLDGHDRLFGLGGNDRVLGGFGNDIVDGGAGEDILLGQRGADDIYTGGADGVRDRVVYSSLVDSGVRSFSRDEVFQFVRGQDKIDLRPIDANTSVSGNQRFHVVSAFTSDRGEVRLVHTAGGDTIVQIDGDRDTAVDMTIRVVGVRLAESDLLL